MTDLWPAPSPEGPLTATVRLPGSKSLTNRALLLAALAEGPSTVRRALRSRDTELMAAALRSLGVGVDTSGDDWAVTPAALVGGPPDQPVLVDCGLAGTVMRFVPPVAATAAGTVTFDGDPHMRTRPLGEVITALRGLGAELDDGGRGSLPLTVHGRGSLRGGTVTIDASASSQFVSALLLAGPSYDEGVDVRHDGKPVPSLPHIEMTVDQLRRRGVQVDDSDANRWQVAPSAVHAVDVDVEPDLSNAAPFLAAALVSGGSVTVPQWPLATTQAGDALREILVEMGAEVTLDETGLRVRSDGQITGVDYDLHDVGELTPVVAALCALAGSPSHLRGVGHIRGHETDRLAALATELHGLGADVAETADGLDLRPATLRPGVFHTYADHRMAHAGVVVGLAVAGTEVEDIATTAKTFPGFAAAWTGFLAAGRSA